MITLPISYNKNGYRFKQTWRQGDIAIYQQFDKDESPDFKVFEVFIVQKHSEKEIFGNITPAHETPPSNEQWGSLGYSVRTIEKAHERVLKLAALIKGRKIKPELIH